MTRRTLGILATAVLAAGLLSACNRSEHKGYNEMPNVLPSPVTSAPMVAPFPTRQDDAVVGGANKGDQS